MDQSATLRDEGGKDQEREGRSGRREPGRRDACKLLVRRFIEESVNEGRLDLVDELIVAPGAAADAGESLAATVKDLLAQYRDAVPDACWRIEEQVADGDTVVTLFTALGTHRGPIGGLAPTHRAMAVPGVLFSRCVGGKIAAQWVQVDSLDLLHQLGVMPALSLDKTIVAARLQQASAVWGRRDQAGPDNG